MRDEGSRQKSGEQCEARGQEGKKGQHDDPSHLHSGSLLLGGCEREHRAPSCHGISGNQT